MVEAARSFWVFGISVILILICGLYIILVTRKLIRILIGMELMTKAVTLLLIAAGHLTGRMALAQSLVITLIVIEVVVIAVAAGIVLCVFKSKGSANVSELRNLRG